jgi:gamma-glutamylcyclotransferase (GGCT)/AIG2-like uncharacterized protein YtfP
MTVNTIEEPHLFVYGTLMSGKSRNHVLEGLSYEKATLKGFKKVEPPSLGFPFIVRVSSYESEVLGEIYYQLTKEHWKIIDMIEGEGYLYQRIQVTIETLSQNNVKCSTYYPKKDLLTSFTEFLPKNVKQSEKL